MITSIKFWGISLCRLCRIAIIPLVLVFENVVLAPRVQGISSLLRLVGIPKIFNNSNFSRKVRLPLLYHRWVPHSRVLKRFFPSFLQRIFLSLSSVTLCTNISHKLALSALYSLLLSTAPLTISFNFPTYNLIIYHTNYSHLRFFFS